MKLHVKHSSWWFSLPDDMLTWLNINYFSLIFISNNKFANDFILRDIRNITVGTLSQQITNQLVSLKGLHSHLQDIQNYLDQVTEKKLPINHTIAYQLQDVFNLLPNLNIDEFSKSFLVKTNDQMLVIYVASMIRSVIALHNLIDNKLQNKDFEKEETRGKDSKDKKDKEKKKESEKSPKEEKEANTSKK